MALPLPHRVLDLYDRFEEGVFGAVSARQLPGLIGLTGIIWCTEGLRLWLVIQALGLPGREPRHLGRVLRRADRVAADGGSR